NHLEQIICDADLYYLGRDDFFPVGQNLLKEFMQYGILADESDWNNIQVKFLSNHQYFTQTAKTNRAPRKAEHLAQILRMAS
ncbi:MAG: phosphohydrolase, partial [Bacteroidota bacterium]